MTAAGQERQGDYWQSHYDSMARHESLYLFSAEANDYFERLEKALDLRDFRRVLDFGCGLGFVTQLLASQVEQVRFWDYSANMLSTADERLAETPNAQPVDLTPPSEPATDFDLIVVNSVIQYMSIADLGGWFHRWRAMLAPSGRLLVSDIILPEPAFLIEVSDSLQFAARKGFLLRTVKNDFFQYARYLKARRQSSLTRYSRDGFRRLAGEAGFVAEWLPENLTYRSNRYSALLRKAD